MKKNASLSTVKPQQQVFFMFTQLTWASHIRAEHAVALDSLYISAKTDIAIYFQSVANRLTMSISSHDFGHNFSIIAQPILQGLTVLEWLIKRFLPTNTWASSVKLYPMVDAQRLHIVT